MTGLSGHEPHARTETSTHPLRVSAIRSLAASSCGPTWARYANEPDALYTICLLHGEQIGRDPGDADWYRSEIAAIEAHLDGRG